MILSVVKIFSREIKLLYSSDTDSRQPYWLAVTRDDVIVDPRISYPLHCTHCLLLLCDITEQPTAQRPKQLLKIS